MEDDASSSLSEEETKRIREAEDRWVSRASTIAGFLSVADGLSKLSALFAFLFVDRLASRFVQSPPEKNEIEVLLFGIMAVVVVAGGMPLLGGYCALERRHWLIAFAGGIAALLPNVPLGALCIIMLAKDRKRFR